MTIPFSLKDCYVHLIPIIMNAHTENLEKEFVFSEKLNSEFLNATYQYDLSFGKKMFSLFLRSIDSDMNSLLKNVDEMNWEETRSVAHKIKNNFTWVGLPQLSSIMYKIENAAKEESDTITELKNELVAQFQSGYDNVKAEHERLDAYLES